MRRYLLGCICMFFSIHGMDKHLTEISPTKSKQCKVQKLELSAISLQNNSLAPSALATKPYHPCTDQKELLHEIQSLFKKQENNLQLYWSDLKATFTPPLPTLEDQNKELQEQARQLRIDKFNTFSNTATDCFDGAATLIYTLGNPKSAAKIQNFGAASFKIASSMNAIIEGASTTSGASLVNPYVGLTIGVCSLIGLFQEHDDNNGFEILMECMQNYVQALSQQLYEQFEFTMQRFDHVENKIDQYGMAMLNEFFLLHQKQDYSLEKLFELRKDFMEQNSMLLGAVDHVNESLAHKYGSLTANLEALRTEKINEIVHKALHDTTKSILPIETFEKHLDKLYGKALVRAKEAHVTGGAVDVTNYESVAQLLTVPKDSKPNSLNHPAYNSINLIRKYINHHYEEKNDEPLANPIIWIQCADAFATLLQKKLSSATDYPTNQNTKELALVMLKKLHTEGNHIDNFIHSLYKKSAIEKIALHYQQTIQEINTIFKRLVTNFEQKKQKELQDLHHQTCTTESSHVSLSPQHLDYESQKQKIRTMYSTQLSEIDRSPCRKGYASFTYQGKNIAGTFKSMRKGKRENEDWSFCNSLLRRSAQTYETDARQDTQNKINNYLTTIQSNLNKKDTLQFSLFDLSHAPAISHSLSNVMYPDQSSVHTLPILSLPADYKIPDYYLLQEQQGRGTIRHEYTYDEKHFYLNSYFISNQGVKTPILSGKIELDSAQAPQVPYDHVFNNWYGGYFAKKNDFFHYNAYYFNGNPLSWSGHIPPVTPYTGLCDTWHKDAEIIFVDNQSDNQSVQTADATLKREFNDTVIKQLNPGTTFFNALKKLDAQCNLIDGLLALTYSQDYPQCNLLRQPNLFPHLINEESIKNYLNLYSETQSNFALSNLHLPHHLTITNELIVMLLDTIKNIPYHILPDLQTTLNRLYQTLQMVELKAVTSHSKQLPQDIKENNTEIELLRTEVLQNRKEIKDLTEKVNMLLDLLTQDKK